MTHLRMYRSLLLPLTALIVTACTTSTPKDEKGPASRTLQVTIGPVIRDSIVVPLVISGKLSTATELKLGFKTGGIIRELHAVEGATVARGTRIARLDTVEFAAWREKARTALEKANRDLARTRQLHEDSVATLEELQNARSALRAAESDATIADFNCSQAVLTAPANGRILKRLAEKNEVIGPGMPVVIFASTEGNWVVRAAIPDRDLELVSIGDCARVSFDALPDRHFRAVLTRIAGAAHPVTGTFEIELTLDETAREFRPGLIADVRLYPAKQQQFSFVPAAALIEGSGNDALVYAVGKGDVFTPVPVVIARIFGDRAAVTAGLDGIDTVVVTEAPYLRSATETITVKRK